MKPHEGAGGATSKSPQPASGSIFLEKPPDGYYHIIYLKNVNEGEDGAGWPASSEPCRSNVQFFQWLPGDRVTGQGNREGGRPLPRAHVCVRVSAWSGQS
jgi:hypothetical protein